MLHWTREALARRVIAELGPLPDDRLKWEVAARLYGADDPVQEAVRQRWPMFPVEAFRDSLLKAVAHFRKHEIAFHLTDGLRGR